MTIWLATPMTFTGAMTITNTEVTEAVTEVVQVDIEDEDVEDPHLHHLVVAGVAYLFVAPVEPWVKRFVGRPEALEVWRPVVQGEVVEVGLVAEGCHYVVVANGKLALTTTQG